ncbi:hypothetical protein ACOMHN_016198 [Nucella lapillus]
MSNLSAVLYGKKDLRMEHRDVREPASGEVLMTVRKAGLCMTDVHVYDKGGVGDIIVTSPLVVGHEFSGVIQKVGSDVTNVKPGDRVAIDSLLACGFCSHCRRGHSNVCSNHAYVGFGSNHGGLAQRTVTCAHNVHKIPDSLSFEEAALMEPLAVCVNAVNRADVTLGDSVIVFGSGPIGLMTLQVALAKGASIVCVADVDEGRLRLAKELGATHIVCFREHEAEAENNAQKLRVALCLKSAVNAVRPRGVVAVVSLIDDDVSLPMTYIAMQEIDLRGCICNNYCFPSAIKLVASQKVKVAPIISHRFPLADLPRALDLVRSRQALKVMVDCVAD